MRAACGLAGLQLLHTRQAHTRAHLEVGQHAADVGAHVWVAAGAEADAVEPPVLKQRRRIDAARLEHGVHCCLQELGHRVHKRLVDHVQARTAAEGGCEYAEGAAGRANVVAEDRQPDGSRRTPATACTTPELAAPPRCGRSCTTQTRSRPALQQLLGQPRRHWAAKHMHSVLQGVFGASLADPAPPDGDAEQLPQPGAQAAPPLGADEALAAVQARVRACCCLLADRLDAATAPTTTTTTATCTPAHPARCRSLQPVRPPARRRRRSCGCCSKQRSSTRKWRSLLLMQVWCCTAADAHLHTDAACRTSWRRARRSSPCCRRRAAAFTPAWRLAGLPTKPPLMAPDAAWLAGSKLINPGAISAGLQAQQQAEVLRPPVVFEHSNTSAPPHHLQPTRALQVRAQPGDPQIRCVLLMLCRRVRVTRGLRCCVCCRPRRCARALLLRRLQR